MIENKNTPSETTDKQLLKAFTSLRDEAAFTLLVARHSSMVKRVCRRIVENEQDVEDCVQAVFMLLARRASLVAWQSSIANWLYGAALRIAKRQWRSKRNARSHEYDMNQHPQSLEPRADGAAEDRLAAIESRLYPAIYALPGRYRVPIVLCYLEGKSRQQAAQELGVSESVIKGRLERAKQALRKKLTSSDDDSLSMLSSGALAASIARTSLPVHSINQISQNALGYALGSTSVGVTANSVFLSNGESFAMLASTQIKLALALLGLFGLVASTFYFASSPGAATSALAADHTQAAANAPSDEKDLTTQRHLRAIAQAIHAYIDAHEGRLPPATLPNPDLPVEKRLSGLVALLPYLGVRPSYLDAADREWQAWHADNARAKAVYAKIDLTKAWDDPANLAAAKTIVPEFLCPLEASTTTADGLALTHFAFVRGGQNRDNGMFPLTGKTDLAITDILDGTSVTVAVGQLHDRPGPWIAGGEATARFLNAASDKSKPGFGSPHPGLLYMANGDASVYCLDVAATPDDLLNKLSGRDDRTILNMSELPQFSSFTEALNRKQK